ncbi:hypothetical protein [Baia soyae]|uniref:Uncharacterized protein n=1 Tax=Baia soyae TaxID=1544746 RepID=A0A4R2S013_9BACL|nr:hypothetical protein [Baia soyae]TCP69233.1 hypothetical protein EDD57_11130 [Baia soyae]
MEGKIRKATGIAVEKELNATIAEIGKVVGWLVICLSDRYEKESGEMSNAVVPEAVVQSVESKKLQGETYIIGYRAIDGGQVFYYALYRKPIEGPKGVLITDEYGAIVSLKQAKRIVELTFRVDHAFDRVEAGERQKFIYLVDVFNLLLLSSLGLVGKSSLDPEERRWYEEFAEYPRNLKESRKTLSDSVKCGKKFFKSLVIRPLIEVDLEKAIVFYEMGEIIHYQICYRFKGAMDVEESARKFMKSYYGGKNIWRIYRIPNLLLMWFSYSALLPKKEDRYMFEDFDEKSKKEFTVDHLMHRIRNPRD